MLITIGTYALADGTAAGGYGIRWTQLAVNRGIELYSLVASTEARTRNTGNVASQIGVEISRQFEDVNAANLFILEHEDDVPDSGLVQFISRTSEGAESVRYLRYGKLQSVSLVEQNGVHVVMGYSFVGGRFTKTKPTE